MKGKFITLEGGEASGKSTNIHAVAEFLKSRDIPFILTHEPGGTPLAEELRAFLLKEHHENISPKTELLLMFASRAQHISEVILPALNAGKWVVCSRFTDSTYAYQGGGRGVPLAEIETLEHLVQGPLQPDLTLLLDIPVEIAFARAKRRGKLDRIEQENRDFFERVRNAYLKRAEAFPKRFRVIDASQSLNVVQKAIVEQLQALNETHG